MYVDSMSAYRGCGFIYHFNVGHLTCGWSICKNEDHYSNVSYVAITIVTERVTCQGVWCYTTIVTIVSDLCWNMPVEHIVSKASTRVIICSTKLKELVRNGNTPYTFIYLYIM